MTKDILKSLNQRPIAYYPVYHKLTESIHGGILLSQLMYWFSKKDKIYKTNEDFMEELGFSERELRTAKTSIKTLSFIITTKEGIPAKTYYRIDWDEYYKVLYNSVTTSNDETVMTGDDDTVTTVHDETVTTNTENTTKTTAENKTKQKKLPENLNIEAYDAWCEFKGKSYGAKGKTLSANKLAKYPKAIQMQMVENSIMNNYKGLFEIKGIVHRNEPEEGSIAHMMLIEKDKSDTIDVEIEE